MRHPEIGVEFVEVVYHLVSSGDEGMSAFIVSAATIVGPLNEGKRPFLKIPLLEFHKSW